MRCSECGGEWVDSWTAECHFGFCSSKVNRQKELNSGTKLDQDKPRMELLSPIALEEVAKVMTFGAKKYGANNWRKGIAWSRVIGACLRHVYSFLSGKDNDDETGLSHLAHGICCLMFLLEYTINKREFDDRYKEK